MAASVQLRCLHPRMRSRAAARQKMHDRAARAIGRTLRDTFSASAAVSPVEPARASASALITCSICKGERQGAWGRMR